MPWQVGPAFSCRAGPPWKTNTEVAGVNTGSTFKCFTGELSDRHTTLPVQLLEHLHRFFGFAVSYPVRHILSHQSNDVLLCENALAEKDKNDRDISHQTTLVRELACGEKGDKTATLSLKLPAIYSAFIPRRFACLLKPLVSLRDAKKCGPSDAHLSLLRFFNRTIQHLHGGIEIPKMGV